MNKILHIVGKMHYGGMETLIMNLYRHMDRTKIQFDILAYYTEPGEYDDEVRQLGGNVYVISKNMNPVKYLYKLTVFFAEHHDYDAVHVHTSWLGWIYFLYADKYNIKKIVHFHSAGTANKGVSLLIKRIFEQVTIKRADDIFTCSQKTASYHKSDSKKTYILKNGIDGNQFYYDETIRKEVRLELGIEHKKVILCVARFDIPKNHDFLIDVLEKMVQKDSNIVLLLVGAGPLETAIKKKVEKLGLNAYVMYMGVRNDVNRLLQGADAYVMPSLWEGLGIVYIESQAAGVKTFASDEAYMKETHISDLIMHRSLADGAQAWAEWILQNMGYERVCKEKELIKSGFEIRETAQALQRFYRGEAEAAELFDMVY